MILHTNRGLYLTYLDLTLLYLRGLEIIYNKDITIYKEKNSYKEKTKYKGHISKLCDYLSILFTNSFNIIARILDKYNCLCYNCTI